MPRPSSQILELAKRGAEYRHRELREELATLVRQFPHLRTLTAPGRRPAATPNSMTPAGAEAAPVRGRRRMSAAARKAVSERMKRFWAERRKAKAAGRI